MKWRTAHTNTILFEKKKFQQNCYSLLLLVIRCHRFSLVVTHCITCCHSLSLIVPLVATCCYSLSLVVPLVVTYLPLVVTRCYSLSLVVPLVVTRCHSLSLFVPLVVIRYHSLYHSLSLFVTQCTTRLSFYKRSSTSALVFFWRLKFLTTAFFKHLINFEKKHCYKKRDQIYQKSNYATFCKKLREDFCILTAG